MGKLVHATPRARPGFKWRRDQQIGSQPWTCWAQIHLVSGRGQGTAVSTTWSVFARHAFHIRKWKKSSRGSVISRLWLAIKKRAINAFSFRDIGIWEWGKKTQMRSFRFCLEPVGCWVPNLVRSKRTCSRIPDAGLQRFPKPFCSTLCSVFDQGLKMGPLYTTLYFDSETQVKLLSRMNQG